MPADPQEKARSEESVDGHKHNDAGKSVKRLRQCENAKQSAKEEGEGLVLRYVSTMRDMGVGTPRSTPIRFL